MSPTKLPVAFGNAYALLVFATLGWGGNAVAGKFATGGWEPFTLTCLRWLLVVLILLPFTWKPLQRDRKLLAKHWWYFIGIGAFGMSLFNLLMFLSLKYTSAINVSILQSAMPVLIIFANFVVLSLRVTALQIVGVVVSIVGVFVTTSGGNVLQVFSEGLNRGDAIMLLGSAFYAAYTFALRWRPPVHWLSFMLLVALGAFLMAVPFSLYEFANVEMSMPSLPDWLVLLYIITVPSILSQLCFARSVELIGGNRAGLFINLVPIFGSLLAVLLLGEHFEWFHAAGMALVIGGITMAERFAHT